MEKQIDTIVLLLQEICNHLEKARTGVIITIGSIENAYECAIGMNCSVEKFLERQAQDRKEDVYMQYKDILDKVMGLADLLWAAAAQSENGDCLRTKGIMALASIASDIEHELEAFITDNQEEG